MEPEADPANSAEPDLSPAEILAQLERIVSSPSFVKSERLRRFLRVAVGCTLAGETEKLKEYSIGRDVFDRDDKYDPRLDSIVRVEARRLRSKLEHYYEKVGAGDPVRIIFEQGSYVPTFRRVEKPAVSGKSETAAAMPALDARAVAVLPFANLSRDPGQEYFCDGITDEIINTLAGIPDLQVIARTSTFQFREPTGDVREIARKLGVGSIIEGSVQMSGKHLHISASVVDAMTGRRLRTAAFDRQAKDLFAVQREIARDVADTLHVTLEQSGRSPVSASAQDDLEAYNLLLHGRYLLNKMTPTGYSASIDVLGRAISQFPEYAPYYPVLSEAYCRLYMWGLVSPREAIPPARQAALEALRLNDGSAEGHLVHGFILLLHDWKVDEAVQAVRRTLELQPSNVHAHILGATGCFLLGNRQAAIDTLKRAIRLDPISLNAHRALSAAFYHARQYDESVVWLKRTLEIDPDFREAHYFMGRILLRRGQYDKAEAEFRKIADQPSRWTKQGAIAETYARSGRAGDARALLEEWTSHVGSQYVSPLSYAPVYAGLNDWDAVIGCLENAYEEHSALLIFVSQDPVYDPIRSDMRFKSLLRRIGLESAE